MESLKKNYNKEGIFNIKNESYVDLFIFNSNDEYSGFSFSFDLKNKKIYILGEAANSDLEYISSLFSGYQIEKGQPQFTNKYILIKKGAYERLISLNHPNREELLKKDFLIFEIVSEFDDAFIVYDSKTETRLKIKKYTCLQNKEISFLRQKEKKDLYNRLRHEAINKNLISKKDKVSLADLKKILNYPD